MENLLRNKLKEAVNVKTVEFKVNGKTFTPELEITFSLPMEQMQDSATILDMDTIKKIVIDELFAQANAIIKSKNTSES